MPRTTRAAARADPALADETTATAEIAIAEDTTVVNLDQGATEPQAEHRGDTVQTAEIYRAPLGEIDMASERINHGEQAATEARSFDQENRVVASESESEGSSTHAENVVMVLGAKANSQTARKVKNSGKTLGKGSKQLAKSSIRLQIRQTHSQDFLQPPESKAARKYDDIFPSDKAGTVQAHANDRSLSNLGTEEDDSALKPDDTVPMAVRVDEMSPPISQAPLEAASFLNAPTRGAVTSNAVTNVETAKTPSTAALQASQMVRRKEASNTTKAKLVQIEQKELAMSKRKPAQASNTAKPMRQASMVPNKNSSHISGVGSSKKPQPQAVQKLASLFEPHSEESDDQANKASSLNDFLATPPISPFSDSKDPIEAMDALEDNIEAVEKSIADCKTKQSPNKRAVNSTSNKTDSEKHAATAGQQLKTRISRTSSKQRESLIKRQSTGLQPRTVEALNTPPALQKSTKPLTVSRFRLSSEATAARLKAQREERQKRREEEQQKQKQMKARAAKATTKPVEIRTTTASRARTSLIAEKPKESKVADISTQKRKSATVGPSSFGRVQGLSSVVGRPSLSTSPLKEKQYGKSSQPLAGRKTVSPVSSGLAVCQSSTTQATKATQNASRTRKSLPNSAARVSRSSTMHASTKRPSMPPLQTLSKNNTPRSLKTSSETANSVPSDTNAKKDRELTAKQKAEATQRARLEAAERGRAASREWAERKKRALASSKLEVVSEDTSGKGVTGVQESAENEGNKENEGEIPAKSAEIAGATVEKPEFDAFKINGFAKSVLLGDTPSQDAAAYILAEMKRIEKLRSSIGQA